MTGIVIVGAGECGVRAAFALRERNYSRAITLYGDESEMPYERPPLSKGRTLSLKPIRTQAAYSDAHIDLQRGRRVTSINTDSKYVELDNGEQRTYEKLLVATGARARVFETIERCLTLRNYEDAQRIIDALIPERRIGIIGGGFIGLELAAMARQADCLVTVFEGNPQLMGRAVPAKISAIVQARHQAEGVEIVLEANVVSADSRTVKLDDGSTHDFDVVIAGVGAQPNTELASAAGIDVHNGITVDGLFRTSVANVFAAGDCCNFPYNGARVRLESWRVALEQGEHAAFAMLGLEEHYDRVPWFWSDQFDLGLQVAGLVQPDGQFHHRKLSADTVLMFQTDKSGVLVAAAGVGPGNTVAKDIRVAEKLIGRGKKITPAQLADPGVSLKHLLKTR